MKKVLSMLMVIALSITAMFCLTGCEVDNNGGTKVDGFKGKLTVATNAAFAPFEFTDEKGNYVGVDMDIAREIAAMLNYDLEIKDMEFDSVIAAVTVDNCNIAMAGLTVSAEREESVDFCDPYFEASQVVIAKSDSAAAAATTEATLLAELVGKKVGFQNGTVGQYYVEGDADWGFDGIENVVASGYTNGTAAVMALKNGTIDYVVIDKAPAMSLVANNNGLVAMTNLPLTEENYAFAVPEGNAELKKIINSAMTVLKANGVFDAIIAKYFGD